MASPNPSPNSDAPSVSTPPNSSAPPPSPSPSAPPPSKSSAPPPAPPPSNSSATPSPLPSAPPPSPPPAPPPSNSSAFPTPPPQSPPQPPPPSKNSSASPAPPHPSPPPPVRHSPPKRVPSPPPPHHAASQNVTPTDNLFNSLELSTGSVAVIGTFVGLLALSLVVLAVWILCGRKKKKKMRRNEENICKDISNTDHYAYVAPSPFASTQNSASSTFLRPQYSNASTNNLSTSSDVGMGSSRSWFTYEELSDATDGFSVNNLIGQGGFGCVYKGVLNADGNGRQVAVKQLKAGSGQGEREFRAEVEIISRIHHKHLVSLVGYCISENQRLLIYDFVANNNLDYHLHDDAKPVMDWASRVKVASGAARGLAYLHEDCQPRIIHRDIKSTNILLDNNFEAKVADFGLAKMAMELDLHTHVSTRVMGTFGYMAPEYAASGKLTEKSDVFSFGVVLLELITGRMPVDPSQPLGDESLVERARPLLAEALKTQDFDGLVDPRLESNFIEVEMFRMIEAAAACVRHSAAKRPRMSQIARALDSMDELANLNNGIRPGQSGNLDSREHSARIRIFDRMAFGSKDSSMDFTSRSQRSWRS